MNKLVVANQKMNLNKNEIINYLNSFNINKSNIIFCPTSIYIPYFLEKNLKVGVQNISSHLKGSYTSEVSVLQVSSMNVEYAIIGHSEVRKNFNEDNNIINNKLQLCLNSNIKPILCVGEEEEYDLENTKKIIIKQLEECLNNIDNINNIIIAYEPVFNIGTNKMLNIEKIEKIVLFIKEYIKQKYKIYDIMVLYGGSVNSNNIKELTNISHIDGFLVGSSSIDVVEFKKIIEVACE